MVFFHSITPKFLILLASSTLLTSALYAQSAAPKGDANTPTAASTADLPAASTAAPFRSTFEGYRAYSDDAVTNWKAANNNVADVGGWREYAKQAQQPDTASGTPAAPAAPAAAQANTQRAPIAVPANKAGTASPSKP